MIEVESQNVENISVCAFILIFLLALIGGMTSCNESHEKAQFLADCTKTHQPDDCRIAWGK